MLLWLEFENIHLTSRHVQVNNESAIEFYKKFGFEIVETKKQYYKRIEPSDAYVLQKTIKKNEIDAGSPPTCVASLQNGHSKA